MSFFYLVDNNWKSVWAEGLSTRQQTCCRCTLRRVAALSFAVLQHHNLIGEPEFNYCEPFETTHFDSGRTNVIHASLWFGWYVLHMFTFALTQNITNQTNTFCKRLHTHKHVYTFPRTCQTPIRFDHTDWTSLCLSCRCHCISWAKWGLPSFGAWRMWLKHGMVQVIIGVWGPMDESQGELATAFWEILQFICSSARKWLDWNSFRILNPAEGALISNAFFFVVL